MALYSLVLTSRTHFALYICFALCASAEEPVILQAPEDITVDYGERVSLICEARGNPKPAINFNLNGKPAENYGGVDLEKNENQLVLRLPVNLTSQVECVVANKLGSYRVASTLTVNCE